MEPIFFKSSSELHEWLESNHDKAQELWIGFYKKGSGKIGITPSEALDEVLCYGWIDSVRRAIDEISYANRFSPRKARSPWSLVNIKRVEELTQLGRMQPAGLKAFEQHDVAAAQQRTYERFKQPLDAKYEALFRANEAAWNYFQQQAPFYKQSGTSWVMSAKQEATRLRRLEQLIEVSARGERMPQLVGKVKG
jgi:uncharacterized protein YdeI (YjbR/CyaY-like superfamily)